MELLDEDEARFTCIGINFRIGFGVECLDISDTILEWDGGINVFWAAVASVEMRLGVEKGSHLSFVPVGADRSTMWLVALHMV